MSGFDHWNATLSNGEKVKINDHVYVAPPWSERDGAPYSIARIIEFVPPTAARNAAVRKSTSTEKHARLALFYRPSEISGRAASDHRLLFAAIHSEVHPISWIRGKCFVRHREKIESIQEWKKQPDHFHFLKLFDPYIKREYEMVRSVSVNNVPAQVKKVLVDRYEFLVTEKEMVTDLTEGYRTCRTCEKWASSQETVRCEVCKFFYHMACVQPPLLAKPAKGYSWVCSPCTHQRESSRQGAQFGTTTGVNGVTPPAKAPSKIGLKVKDRKVEPDYDKPDHFYRGWNFRYFGQYTVAEDATDPDDPIFPRSATRVGTKYQAVVPTWEEQLELNKNEVKPEDAPADLMVRGTDSGGKLRTSRLWSTPKDDVGTFIKEVRRLPLPLPAYDLEVYARALFLCNAHGRRIALEGMASSGLNDFKHLKEFTPTELAAFESEIAKWGGILENHETSKVVGRKPSDIVRFYYSWRNTQLGKEHAQNRLQHNAKVGAEIHQRKRAKPSKGLRPKMASGLQVGAAAGMAHQSAEDPEDSEVEESVYGDDELVEPNPKPSCGVCNAKTAPNWWKAPRSLSGNYLCDACGVSFRKYGVAIPNKYEILRADPKKTNGEKRDGTPLSGPAGKKQKIAAVEAAAIPINPGSKPPPCALCRRTENKVMARCKNCAFSMHAGCYGIPPEDVTPDWLCEPCANEVSLEVALQPKCVLCPKTLPPLTRPTKKPGATYDFDFLHALKPTEGYKWAHILCSLFIPEVVYSDEKRLRVAEGISALPAEKWLGVCSVCKQTGGAVISCAHQRCSERKAHAACAWLAGWKFNFDLLVPNRKMAFAGGPVYFGSEARHMVPKCWCEKYPADSSDLLELFATEPNIGLSALQLYAHNYKKSFDTDTFPLLRKALRLESLMPEPITREASLDEYSLARRPVCHDCGVKASPKWYDIGHIVEDQDAMELDDPVLLHPVPERTDGGVALLPIVNGGGDKEKENMNGKLSVNGEGGQSEAEEEMIGLALPAVSRRTTSSRALTPREDNGSMGGEERVQICHQCHWEKKRTVKVE